MSEHGSRQAPPSPEFLDVSKPNAARMYNVFLGDTNNYAADRVAADKAIEAVPGAPKLARSNRTFLLRVVREAARAGITQFLDLGAGIPSVQSVHEQAREIVGEQTRVVYVDYEHVACAHGTVAIEDQGVEHNAGMVQADFRDVDEIFQAPETRRLLDLSQPVMLLTVALWHFVGDGDQPHETMRKLSRKLAPGSMLGITHLTYEGALADQQEGLRNAEQVYSRTANPLFPRTRDEISALIAAGGWELLEPGLVQPAQWRPHPADPRPEDVDTILAAGVATA